MGLFGIAMHSSYDRNIYMYFNTYFIQIFYDDNDIIHSLRRKVHVKPAISCLQSPNKQHFTYPLLMFALMDRLIWVHIVFSPTNIYHPLVELLTCRFI